MDMPSLELGSTLLRLTELSRFFLLLDEDMQALAAHAATIHEMLTLPEPATPPKSGHDVFWFNLGPLWPCNPVQQRCWTGLQTDADS